MSVSPFPGMDPYLEAPSLWRDVHSQLMTLFREQLVPHLAPHYTAELDTQVVLEMVVDNDRAIVPDVTIAEAPSIPKRVAEMSATYEAIKTEAVPPQPVWVLLKTETRINSLYIRSQPSRKLVAVIELLSPTNKRPGDHRLAYLRKRHSLLKSRVHFVEIDLLRSWPRMLADELLKTLPAYDYLAFVRDAAKASSAQVWPIRLQNTLPVLPIPLLTPGEAVSLDLGEALRTAYARARYDLRIDYTQPPSPPLTAEAAAWAQALLATAQPEAV